jgi:hypothetical protein
MSECPARNGGFLAYPRQHSRRTQPALQDTNGPQKPGRATAPTGTSLVPIASAASDLDLPLQRGLSLARDVFGRRSTRNLNTMDTSYHAGGAADDQLPASALTGGSLFTAHTCGQLPGRKSIPFAPGLTLRVGKANRKMLEGVPTLPTQPTGLAERGRKSTPLCSAPRVRCKGWLAQGWSQ